MVRHTNIRGGNAAALVKPGQRHLDQARLSSDGYKKRGGGGGGAPPPPPRPRRKRRSTIEEPAGPLRDCGDAHQGDIRGGNAC